MSDRPKDLILSRALDEFSATGGQDIAVVYDSRKVCFEELLAESREFEAQLAQLGATTVAIVVTDIVRWVSAVIACERLALSCVLIRGDGSATDGESLALDFPVSCIVTDREIAVNSCDDVVDPEQEVGDGEKNPVVTIVTSGTSGKPKQVRHTWRSLAKPIRLDARYAGSKWLLSYPVNFYAGLQVFLQCFLNGGTLVVPPPGQGIDELAEFCVQNSVEYASGTPSFWRRLVTFASRDVIAKIPLRQLTLGGEPVTNDLLNVLGDLFPRSRIVHIYATSELGRCFSVTDRRAGFPANFLERPPEESLQLQIRDGELYVKSANRMLGYAANSTNEKATAGWFATGDIVEIEDDRVYFRGRRTDLINVGGNKVSPLEVEAILRKSEDVWDVRVYPIASSMVGQMVGADVVLTAKNENDDARSRLAQYCSENLLPYQRPRKLSFVDSIELTAAGKTSRLSEESG